MICFSWRLRRALSLLFTFGAFSFPLLSCSHLFYQPSSELFYDPTGLKLPFSTIEFKTSDRVKLSGWYFPRLPHHPPKGLLLQFHGNAQNISAHFASLVWIVDQGYDFMTFDYRGYGQSEGEPSAEGLNRDALAAISEAVHRSQKNGLKGVALVGQSLGGAVLLRAFQEVSPEVRKGVRIVVVDSSFYSYQAEARTVLSNHFLTTLLQPLAYLLISDEYTPEQAIASVSPIPLVVVHSKSDPVVPNPLGKRIFDLAREPKQYWEVKEPGHIEAFALRTPKYRKRLIALLDSLF